MGINLGLSGNTILFVIVLIFIGGFVCVKIYENRRNEDGSASKNGNELPGKPMQADVQKTLASDERQLPVIQPGIDDETVAAIMAAVSCMTDQASGIRYVVKSIGREQFGRPVWGFAGMLHNTRPF